MEDGGNEMSQVTSDDNFPVGSPSASKNPTTESPLSPLPSATGPLVTQQSQQSADLTLQASASMIETTPVKENPRVV